MNYIPPEYKVEAFNCPYCNAYAHQQWFSITFTNMSNNQVIGYQSVVKDFEISRCARCWESAIWYQSKLVFPSTLIAPLPSTDMPPDVAADFNEAREVLTQSPRSSAALLRLAIQKLCKELGQPGKNLNEDIGALVKAGLPPRIQQALDTVRVIGNNAVHPGELDLRDDKGTALALFGIVNMIIEVMITHPREMEEIYNKLPVGALKGIAQRDQTP